MEEQGTSGPNSYQAEAGLGGCKWQTAAGKRALNPLLAAFIHLSMLLRN
jgi:hypothetical protein